MREPAEKRLREIVSGARLSAVVSGGYYARVLRERPAVVHEALQHYLEDDRLSLLGCIGELIEKQYVELSVLAQALQLHQPYRLYIYDLIARLVVYGASVDGLRRLVDELYVEHLRVYLLYAVALAVARKSVYEHRDVRLYVGAYELHLVVLVNAVRAARGGLRIVFREKLIEEGLLQIGVSIFSRKPREESSAAYEELVDLVIIPANRLHLYEDLIARSHSASVAVLHVSGVRLFSHRHPYYLLGAEPVYRALLSGYGIAAACLFQRACP